MRDAAAVMTCLKRALKIANAAQQQLTMSAKRSGLSEPVSLFVDALNQYLYYFEQELPDITTAVLQVCGREGGVCSIIRMYCNSRALL